MWYLIGIKRDGKREVVATFDSEQLLLSYVRWATLSSDEDGALKFEQKTPLTGCTNYEYAQAPLDVEEPPDAPHNPTPGML